MPMLTTSYPTVVLIGSDVNALVIAELLVEAEITNVQIFDSAAGPTDNNLNHEHTAVDPYVGAAAQAILEELIFSVQSPYGVSQTVKHVHVPMHSIKQAILQSHLLEATIAGLGEDSLHWRRSLIAIDSEDESSTITASFAVEEETDIIEIVVADAIIVTDEQMLSSIANFNPSEHKRLAIVPNNAERQTVDCSSLINARDVVDAITFWDNTTHANSYQQQYDIPKAFDQYRRR